MKKLVAIMIALSLMLSMSIPALAAKSDHSTVIAISAEQAKTIALEHANVNAADAVFEEVELKTKKGIYEIEFYTVKGEYEYEISAVDGSVKDYEWDLTVVAISAEQAKTIALEHANVNAADAIFKKVELNTKKSIYEIKFYTSKGEYEYEISAVDGSVKDYEWDLDDKNSNHDNNNNNAQAGWITSKAAQATALADAGITTSNVKYINAYVTYKNGTPYAYHVEFGLRNNTNTEYHYEIDLYSGSILNANIERH